MAKILVIDDDKSMLQIVKSILTNEGYVVKTISDWTIVFDKSENINLTLLSWTFLFPGQMGGLYAKN